MPTGKRNGRRNGLSQAAEATVARMIQTNNEKTTEWRSMIPYGDFQKVISDTIEDEYTQTTAKTKYGCFRLISLRTTQLGGSDGPYSGADAVRVGDQVTLKKLFIYGGFNANTAVVGGSGPPVDIVPWRRQFLKLFLVQIPVAATSELLEPEELTLLTEICRSLPMPAEFFGELPDAVHEARKVRKILWSKEYHPKCFYTGTENSTLHYAIRVAEAIPLRENINLNIDLEYADVADSDNQQPLDKRLFMFCRWGNQYERIETYGALAHAPEFDVALKGFYQDK